MTLPIYSTEATDSLCREIAKKSHGTIFLMLSRGKDSLCAYLQCLKYFSRVLPFHCATVPGYRFADEYLDYLEAMFNTRILRMMGEDLKMALVRYIYQDTPWECDVIDQVIPDVDFTKLDVLEYLRMKFNLPRAWCAVGISKNDSIDRLIYCRSDLIDDRDVLGIDDLFIDSRRESPGYDHFDDLVVQNLGIITHRSDLLVRCSLLFAEIPFHKDLILYIRSSEGGDAFFFIRTRVCRVMPCSFARHIFFQI